MKQSFKKLLGWIVSNGNALSSVSAILLFASLGTLGFLPNMAKTTNNPVSVLMLYAFVAMWGMEILSYLIVVFSKGPEAVLLVQGEGASIKSQWSTLWLSVLYVPSVKCLLRFIRYVFIGNCLGVILIWLLSLSSAQSYSILFKSEAFAVIIIVYLFVLMFWVGLSIPISYRAYDNNSVRYYIELIKRRLS